ncbi:MAG: hypothetical protein P8P74_00780 [Crocinitomicaceae bacterium]|nr:hypothetical protein [Crocinitomicaceae bacterium]
MNRQTQIGVFFGTIVFMVLMVWIFSAGGDEERKVGKKSRPTFVSSDWEPQYEINDKNPLGLYLFTTLTQAHLDKQHDVKVINTSYELDSLQQKDSTEKTYMFVGNYFGMDLDDLDSVLSDVRRGSRLFISFDNLYDEHYFSLFDSVDFQFDYDQEVNVYANGKPHNMISLYQKDTIARKWWAFGNYGFPGGSEELSSFMEMPNFLKVEYGDGYLYLHSTPNLFFNYQIKRKPGYRYAAFVLNNLPKDQDVHLLEVGRLPDDDGEYDLEDFLEDNGEGDMEKQDDSLLQFIFKEPNLLTALLLCILGLILFVIFRSKRTRPVVPFIPKKKNMTMAFAETITSIYLSKRNPYGLLQVQRKNFYDTIHRYFFVDLNHRNGDRELQILSEKSNTPIEEIKAIIDKYETKQAASVSEEFVANLAKQRHAFYRRVGIISDKLVDRLQMREMVFKRAMWLPALMILVGIVIVLVGIYFLTTSVGIGIALWPIGMILTTLGVLRLSKPYLTVTKEHLTYYSPLARKHVFNRADLNSTEVLGTGVVLNFNNNRKLIINYWDLSAFDRKQFERFVSRLHIQEL